MVRKIKVACDRCKGSGYVPTKDGDVTCPVCHDAGEIEIFVPDREDSDG